MRTRAAAVLLLLAVTALAAPSAPPALFIRAGRALLPDGSEMAPARLLVRGEWIEAVGPDLAAPEGTAVLDRPDGVLVAGFVDAHAWLDRGETLGEPARVSTPDLRAADAGRPGGRALAAERGSGVTAICLAPSDAGVIGGRPAILFADGTVHRERAGLKAALGGAVLGVERFPSSQWGALDALRAAPALAAAEEAGERVLLRADTAADVAAALRLLAERPELRVALVGGREAWRRAADLAAAGAAVVWGPASLADRDLVLRGPAVLSAAGVRLAFGTDGRPGTLRRTAVLAHRAGLPRDATLRALGAGAAEVLGAEGEMGGLAKGLRADLALFDGDPLDLSARVTDVVIGGRVVAPEEDR